VRQAALDAGATASRSRAGLTEDDQSLIEQIEGYGVRSSELTDEERQAFVDATRPVYDAWRDASAPIWSRWPRSRSPTADPGRASDAGRRAFRRGVGPPRGTSGTGRRHGRRRPDRC
jgi:hypothetical protein